MAVEITKENFDQEVLQSDVPVAAFFQLPNCAKCVVFKSFADGMEQKNAGKFKLAVFNIMKTQALAKQLGVSSTPSFIIFSQGQEENRFFGNSLVKEDIEQAINAVIQ